MNLWLEVVLESDTCFSQGLSGRAGDVDTEVEHDPRTGLPLLRGRTLKGLLVEEVALVLAALEPDQDAGGPWHDAAGRLFGFPGAAISNSLRIGDGHLPEDVAHVVGSAVSATPPRWVPSQVREALTTVRRQTKVNDETGGPEEGSLRATRLLRAGLVFRHPLDLRGAPSARERGLLAGAVVAVRRAGLHRNRGWGAVRLRLLDEGGTDLTASWLRLLASPVEQITPSLPNEAPRAAPTVAALSPAAPSARTVVTYSIRLTAPLLLGMEGGDPSTVETLRYASGSALLGAMAQRFLGRTPVTDPAAASTAEGTLFRKLFLTGETRWLHAYPAGSDDRRLLPVPRSWRAPKDDPESPYDRVAMDEADDRQPSVAVAGWFVDIRQADSEVLVRHRAPEVQVRLHQARDREAGRATTRSGALFSYVALSAGERLIGHVLCQDQSAASAVCDLLESGPFSLGRSRTATYGGGILVESVASSPARDWREAAVHDGAEDHTVITLLSDYLGRNDHGQADPAALVPDLVTALALPAGESRCFLASRAVSGHVSVWQMPRPRHQAVAAGSVLVLPGRPDVERVRELLWRGIGDRRAEGFGRVAVDWHGGRGVELTCGPIDKRDIAGRGPAPRGTSTPSPALALLRRNLLVAAAERNLRDLAAAHAGQTAPQPSTSLVSRIRAVVRASDTLARVEGFLLDIRGKNKRAGRSLERARRGHHVLAEWLVLVAKPTTPFGEWAASLSLDETAQNAGVDVLALQDERPRLTRLYLDAYCEALRRHSRTVQRGGETS